MGTTQVFSGNAAIPYAAFNLKDPYYAEIARMVIAAARARCGGKLGTVVDLGAGIGISTMEILKEPGVRHIIAVEPEEGMRYLCSLNVMGDPRVRVVEGKGENLFQVAWPVIGEEGTEIRDRNFGGFDAVICSQVFHLFNPPGKESLVPQVLGEVVKTLRPGGVFAFDLGPTNFKFFTPISDHRRRTMDVGEIMTELSHPLYQRAHTILYQIVMQENSDFVRDNLWPPVAARMDFEFLSLECARAGLSNLEVKEEFLPLTGARVINFIRNGWTVFFRWPPLDALSNELKLELMTSALHQLFRQKDFEALRSAISYHPTAVFTALKG